MQTYADQLPTYTKKSLLSILWQKAVGYVERKKAPYLLKKATELLAGLVIGAILIRPEVVMNLAITIFEAQNYALPKVALGLTIVWARKYFFRFFRKLQSAANGLDKEKLIDGIPAVELADYLIRNKHFKREGVNGVRATFGIGNMEKFNRLAAKLEENKVLVRGVNNSRVLDAKWSRQALIDYLSGCQESRRMEPWLRVRRIGANSKVRLDSQEITTSC